MRSVTLRLPRNGFSLVVEEITELDRFGRRILYIASVYLQPNGLSARRLLRRSRVPGSAHSLLRDTLNLKMLAHIPVEHDRGLWGR
jgi:hypothetical protein